TLPQLPSSFAPDKRAAQSISNTRLKQQQIPTGMAAAKQPAAKQQKPTKPGVQIRKLYREARSMARIPDYGKSRPMTIKDLTSQMSNCFPKDA
ncbi:MAG: hypothetical protein RBT25_07890, partial [Lentisphaeria bacterium]|nr:hypothetical protein [Lentisphaeria bacterium]